MQNTLFESMKLSELARSPADTQGVYFVPFDKLQDVQKNVTSAFSKAGGKPKQDTFASVNTRTGEGFYTLRVTVIEPGRPKQTVGRKRKS